MGVTLCRQRIGVTEKPTDDLQAEAAGNQVRGMGVAVVVKAVVVEARLLGNAAPEFLDALQRLVGCVAGEKETFPRVSPLLHLCKQRQGRSGQGKVFPPFLLRMVRWLDPDAPAQIDV